jgi:hypothetical protein
MHGPINLKSPNNIREWHMGFNSAFKGLKEEDGEFLRKFHSYLLEGDCDSS